MAKNLNHLNQMTPVDELMVRLFHAPRILVVEDATAPAELLLYRNYDCTVDTTMDGAAAAKLLATKKYDLVLVDLALLNGTSEMVLKAAQQYCPDTPVVVTKVAEAELDVLMHRVGPVTLVTAPLTLDVVAHLFRVFKIKARTREIAAYCCQLADLRATAAAV